MTVQEACAQAFENGRRQGDAEGYARGKAEAVKHGRLMAPEKLKAMEDINRTLGWLGGISYVVEPNIANGILDAVEVIKNSLKVVFEDGN